ncbi:hypothetical protein [Emcibacter sp. SYSU 3D8]|uniref:hypothetical protein n=1 Tax=Emcibacter sp. SYSU 3D8 TaxID=3133969 RepID=UPI0031FF42DE
MATTLFPFSSWFAAGTPFAGSAQGPAEVMAALARIGAEASRQVLEQQQEMAATILESWRETAVPRDPAGLLELPLEAARLGTRITLQNASQLAGITRQAQSDLLAVMAASTGAVAADAVEKTIEESGKLAKDVVAKAAATGDASIEEIALAGQLVE